MRRLLLLLVLALAALAATFVLGMRRKSPAVLGAVRRMNKAVMNPAQLKTAGTPGAYASIVRHEGRRSGRSYETPVVAVATEEGFVTALPYGDAADWVRNVLASGRATVVHEGEVFEVAGPELVDMVEVAALFPPADQRAHEVFGVERALRWGHKAPVGATAAPTG